MSAGNLNSQLINYYQYEVDKGKLTAIAKFEKLEFEDKGQTFETSAFQTSLWHLNYLSVSQLYVDKSVSLQIGFREEA